LRACDTLDSVSRPRDGFSDEGTFTEASGQLHATDHGEGHDDSPLKLLVIVAGGVQEFNLPPDGTPLAVGRSPRNHVYIDSPSVSRVHARVVPAMGSAFIQDLGSTNGTYVNGNKVTGAPVGVRAGDMIRFGDVPAHVRAAEGRKHVPRRVSPPQLDGRITEEADRCIRSDRALVVLAIEILGPDPDLRAWPTVASCLRSIDIVCDRSKGRIDALLVDSDRRDGEGLAQRLLDALAARNLKARIGVASFPGDAPSPDALMVAANLAMRGIEGSGLAVARAGARTLAIGTREIVVAEAVMTRLYGMVERLASSKVTVLVTGETGVGKDLVAEALHALGSRTAKRLIKLNCAALPEQLLENELFGHERGAFSGASEAAAGLFEEADGGTLFLDEIGEMASNLQAKLLRVLEDGNVRRIGSTRDRQVDVRVVAATHRDLKQLVEEGKFRNDLYFRLKGVVLHVPPLRSRQREIPILAERFAAEAADDVQRALTLAPATTEALVAYAWPGNIRELRHAISAAAVTCEGDVIEPKHLPPEIAGEAAQSTTGEIVPRRTAPTAVPLAEEIETIQRERIVEALVACEGNQTRAAERLQMPRRTLVHKISQLGIDVPSRPGRPRKG
jgi:two-component system, NtrC family, response regulator AtoC